MPNHTVSECPCGCKAWHVSGVAEVQGVNFTELQARAVAQLLGDEDLMIKLSSKHFREEEVVALRAEVARLGKVVAGYRESMEEFMTPQGATNVIESWLSETGKHEELRETLLRVCKKEGWE
jgi:hypothetical protein